MNAALNQFQTATHILVDQDICFESHFAKGNTSVYARLNAPKLSFCKSMPLESVRDNIAKWNAAMQESFEGHGYYAFSPMDEMNSPDHHIVVLFANDAFYQAFMGSVDNVDYSIPSIFDKPAKADYVVEEISYDNIMLPWDY